MINGFHNDDKKASVVLLLLKLQDILADTGVSVDLPPSDSLSESVVLCGEPEKLGIALTMVYSKVNYIIKLTCRVN